MEPKWSQMGSPKCAQNQDFEKKVPKVVWTHYLLYILTTGTLQKPYFFIPPSNENAGLFRGVPRMPPRGCKMATPGPKNGESGVPWDPQGCQRVSQCLLRCSKKTSKISIPLQECLQGCLGCPTAPKIPPFFTFPRPALPQVGGTFEPSPPTLSYTPLTSSFASVKHPSSAAVWAYAHLDKPSGTQLGIYRHILV